MINAWVEGVQEPSRELQMAGANTGCNRGLLGNEGGSPSRHRIRRAQVGPLSRVTWSPEAFGRRQIGLCCLKSWLWDPSTSPGAELKARVCSQGPIWVW